jgi:hypothetical protein
VLECVCAEVVVLLTFRSHIVSGCGGGALPSLLCAPPHDYPEAASPARASARRAHAISCWSAAPRHHSAPHVAARAAFSVSASRARHRSDGCPPPPVMLRRTVHRTHTVTYTCQRRSQSTAWGSPSTKGGGRASRRARPTAKTLEFIKP